MIFNILLKAEFTHFYPEMRILGEARSENIEGLEAIETRAEQQKPEDLTQTGLPKSNTIPDEELR